MWRAAEAEGRGLLRLLLVRVGQMSADAGRQSLLRRDQALASQGKASQAKASQAKASQAKASQALASCALK
jgi:hypothetical protein